MSPSDVAIAPEMKRAPLTAEQLYRMEENKKVALERKRKREEEEAEALWKKQEEEDVARREKVRAVGTPVASIFAMSKSRMGSSAPLPESPLFAAKTDMGNRVTEKKQPGYQSDVRDMFGIKGKILGSEALSFLKDMEEVAEMHDARMSQTQSQSQTDSSGLTDETEDVPSAVIGGLVTEMKKKPPPVEAVLSQEQQDVLQKAVEGKSIFITGCGGTGKSFLMHKVIEVLKTKFRGNSSSVGITATTGIAATHIGGVSFHNFCGIGIGQGKAEELAKKIQRNRTALQRWRSVRALVVDEISMLDADLFDKVEHVARLVRANSSKFGGIQLLLVGDFLQLPPVAKGGEPKFCFAAKSWKTCVDVHVELKHVFRQSDKAFVSALNAIRWGRVTPEVTAMLTAASNNKFDDKSGVKPTMLYPRNAQVDEINAQSLRSLPTPSRIFSALTVGEPMFVEQLNKNCLAPEKLELKRGAQVMLLKNLDSKNGLSNGSIGTVDGFKIEELESGAKIEVVVVTFEDPDTGEPFLRSVEPHDFPLELAGKQVAVRTQYPLRLAYAITIHKCQGMTLSKVEMSLKSVFEHGQAYVALSRASTPQGLRVISWAPHVIKANPKVVAFYQTMGVTAPAEGASSASAGGGSVVSNASSMPSAPRVNPLLCDE